MDYEIRILGRTWLLRSSPGMRDAYGCWGDCDPPSMKSKALRYDPGQDDYQLLDTLLHEMLHAAFPWMSEEYVTRFATDQARAACLLFSIERITTDATEEAPATQDSDAPAKG